MELVVDESVSASRNVIDHALLFRLSVFPVPPRAAVQPPDADGQLSWLLPVSAIAPLSWALKTAVNGSRTAASAGAGVAMAPTTTSAAVSAMTAREWSPDGWLDDPGERTE